MDAAAADLPVSYIGNDYGRVTRGAAMAVKARLLLYAASPLFNGYGGAAYPSPTTPERNALVGYTSYDVTRWQAAADAANAIIQSGLYQLNVDNKAPGFGFYSLFLQRINSEYIFYFNRANNRDMEGFYLPPSRGGNHNGQPTQTLVDAFPMKNGKPISDPSSLYDPTKPFLNRDPRFHYSVIYNTANYYSTTANAQAPVYTYVGAPQDGFPAAVPLNSAGVTGYYSRKMCDSTLAGNSSGNTQRGYGIIRYAEILLNYAEAINETGHPELAYPVLISLRQRAGITPNADGLYGMKANMSVSEMRAFVQNERHIELMYEDSRWYDVRRWKIAMTTQNGYNKLMRITKNANGTYSYQVVNSIILHSFSERNYLLPIPTSELLKAPAMLQNPGWY